MPREGRGGRRPTVERRVIQLDIESGHPIKKWPSVRSAAYNMGCSPSNIVKVCQGKRNQAAGYGWSYTI